MHTSVTLTADEFKTIHNGLCELRFAVEKLNGVLSPQVFDRLEKAKEAIYEGLQGAYQQEKKSFDARYKHYDSVATDLGLKSRWSIYEIEDLNEPFNFSEVDHVVYETHWGNRPVTCKINGKTWNALWVAADACIRDSGDTHHIFIESFTKRGNALVLSTGS